MSSNAVLNGTNVTSSLVQLSSSSDVYENEVSLRMARIICTQILMPIVCAVGVAGNTLNIIVLTRATMRSSTSCYLCAVAVYDLLYSLNGLPLTLRTYTSLEKSVAYMKSLTYLLPLGNMWGNITTWLTCVFTIERFMAISTPIRSRKNFSIRRTQWNIILVSVLIAIITLPDFFERRIREAQKTCTHPAGQPNVECDSVNSCVETFYVFETTWIGTQLDRYGWSYANVALFVFIPLIILAIFNALLIKSVIKAHHERNKILTESQRFKFDKGRSTPLLTEPPTTRRDLAWRKWWITRQYYQQSSTYVKPQAEERTHENTFGTTTTAGAITKNSGELTSSEFQNKPPVVPYCFRCKKRENPRKHGIPVLYLSSHQDKQSITITLIAVVVVFCTLNSPSAVIHLIRPCFKPSDVRLKIFGNVSNLLLMLNAAMNFFLYSLFSARFRRSFRLLIERHRC